MLVLWKSVCLQPLLSLSRGAIQTCFRLSPLPESGSGELITVDSGNGEWNVHAMLLGLPERDITKEIAGQHEAAVRTPIAMLQCFSVCLPIFWALSLAVW